MTNDTDRREVENVIALLCGADEHLRCALLKLVQWARTNYEQDIINEVLDARKEVKIAHQTLLQFHPNQVSREKGPLT